MLKTDILFLIYVNNFTMQLVLCVGIVVREGVENLKKFLGVVFAATMAASVCIGCDTEASNNVNSLQEGNFTQVQEAQNTEVQTVAKADYSAIRSDIEEIIGGEYGEYSVYLWYSGYQQDDALVINDQSRRSASMIKVFIMGYAMELASQGRLDLNSTITLTSDDKVGGAGVICGWDSGTDISIRELISLMITESDNTATNMMIDCLGMENINSYIARNGYGETVLQRKMMDFDAVAAGRENYSSVRDLGRFFTKLAQHQCVNADYDQQMIDILLRQTDTEVFPAALYGVDIAHKTGELDNLYDDGGIIFTAKGGYVLVIMNDGISRYSAVSKMQSIASATYGAVPN